MPRSPLRPQPSAPHKHHVDLLTQANKIVLANWVAGFSRPL